MDFYNIKKRYIFFLSLILLSSILYSGCMEENQNNNHQEVTSETLEIRIGTISTDVEKIVNRFQPQADYLAEQLSNETVTYIGKVVLAATISDMIDLLLNDGIDLYIESPLTTALIVNKSGAVPLLRRWKDGSAEYHTVFVVRNDSNITSFDDLIGKKIGFEAEQSSSGYLIPKAYLIRLGYTVTNVSGENVIQYEFTNEDENTALWVVEERVDCGAMSNLDYLNNPENIINMLRIINVTSNVPRHIVSYRYNINPDLINNIKQILLDMDDSSEGREVLEEFKNTVKYDEIPNQESLFEELNTMLKILELI